MDDIGSFTDGYRPWFCCAEPATCYSSRLSQTIADPQFSEKYCNFELLSKGIVYVSVLFQFSFPFDFPLSGYNPYPYISLECSIFHSVFQHAFYWALRCCGNINTPRPSTPLIYSKTPLNYPCVTPISLSLTLLNKQACPPLNLGALRTALRRRGFADALTSKAAFMSAGFKDQGLGLKV